jgi:o-succinylbenzoate---CoA ligase
LPVPDLVAIRLPDPAAAVVAIDDAWQRGQAVLVLDPAAPDRVATEILRQQRPSGLVHLRPDGVQRITRLPDGVEVPDGTAAVVTTSGSTGRPRGIVLSHGAMEASAAASIDRLGCTDRDRWLLCLPLHHVAGLAVLVRSRLLASAPDVLPRFDVSAVAASTATWWPLVPTMLHRLLDAGVDLAGRGILLGGAAADPAPVVAARQHGARVIVGYGMTETCGGCVYDGTPLDGVEVAVDNGRIRLRGPVLATGERRDGALVSIADADGWLTTGDVGRVVDGRLVIDGRADAVIVTGGENVAAEAVEQALQAHPTVAAAGVVGVPDPEWGQRVVALVVPSDPDTPPTLASLRDHVEASVGRHAAPRELHLVDALPRVGLAKLDRTALADIARSRAGEPHPPATSSRTTRSPS